MKTTLLLSRTTSTFYQCVGATKNDPCGCHVELNLNSEWIILVRRRFELNWEKILIWYFAKKKTWVQISCMISTASRQWIMWWFSDMARDRAQSSFFFWFYIMTQLEKVSAQKINCTVACLP